MEPREYRISAIRPGRDCFGRPTDSQVNIVAPTTLSDRPAVAKAAASTVGAREGVRLESGESTMADAIFSTLGTIRDDEKREVEAIIRRRGRGWVLDQLLAWNLQRGDLENVATRLHGFDAGPLAYLRDQVASIEGVRPHGS